MLDRSLVGLILAAFLWVADVSVRAASRPNVLIVTVDDMSCDSVGVYGCPVPETTPTMDRFARTALRFQHAHVQVGNCMPGRNLMWSGLYSHVNGVEGFRQNQSPDYPVLCDLARAAGYFTAIRGKVAHSTPYSPYPGWDAVLDESRAGNKYHVKDVNSYGASTRRGIELAAESGKPFCLLINISDPHKPFYGRGKRNRPTDDPFVPSRVYHADEMVIPGFLFDDPQVRQELALYYSTVRRADDCLAKVLSALKASGQADNTLVMFFSDHGMPLPFAKTQLYHHSTHTPLMIRWPGVTQAGGIEREHMVSAIDFLPTLLEVMETQHPTPERLQGRSFVPVLKGQPQSDRDWVIKQYNENAGRWRHPMRGIQTKRWLYLYNPWSNGERKFASATTGTVTYRRLQMLSARDAELARRLELFDHRVIEELYDIKSDPDCLQNRIDDASVYGELVMLRKQLHEELQRIGDPVAPLVGKLGNDALRQAYMAAEDKRSAANRKRRQIERAKRRSER